MQLLAVCQGFQALGRRSQNLRTAPTNVSLLPESNRRLTRPAEQGVGNSSHRCTCTRWTWPTLSAP